MAVVARPRAVDLFCGAGGMSLGFEQAGFDIVAAADADAAHVRTHSRNFPQCKTVKADLSELSGDELRDLTGFGGGKIDVVFGGPPCQGFSLMGKRQLQDQRNHLLLHFGRLVVQLCPRYFVLENVEGLLITRARGVLSSFLRAVRKGGYRVVAPTRVLDARDFGVPQRRRRSFLLGYQKGLTPPRYPKPMVAQAAQGDGETVSVWAAIRDLLAVERLGELLASDVYRGELGPASPYAQVLRGDIEDTDDQASPRSSDGLSGCRRSVHTEKTIQRFQATKPGTYEPISRFYRLTKHGHALALRAGTGASHGSYTAPRPIHPVSPRCITVREAARLHGLPDWFDLDRTIWHGFRQVGNSVPPPLARAVARGVLQALASPNDRRLR